MQNIPKPTEFEVADFKKKLGKNIKFFRERKNLSQEKLAEKIGLASSTLGLLEIGRSQPKISTLISITRALEINPYELFVFGDIENIGEKRKLITRKVKNMQKNDKNVLALYYFLENFE